MIKRKNKVIEKKRLSKNKFIWIVSILLIIPLDSSLTVQNLNYDSNQSEVNVTYDSLNRIPTKNTSSSNSSLTHSLLSFHALSQVLAQKLGKDKL